MVKCDINLLSLLSGFCENFPEEGEWTTDSHFSGEHLSTYAETLVLDGDPFDKRQEEYGE